MTTRLVYATSLFRSSLYIFHPLLYSSQLMSNPFRTVSCSALSDKKPGEVASRQLIFAILLICILHRLSLYLLPKMALLFQEAIAAENLGCELENSLGMSNLKPSHRLYFINFLLAHSRAITHSSSPPSESPAAP